MKYELLDSSGSAVIKVIGVGGGGGNAVNHMAADGIDGVQFICANTDAQALREMNVESIVQLGVELTKGLGAVPGRKSVEPLPKKTATAFGKSSPAPTWCF